MEYIVFTDESSITNSRYPSISAFSMPYNSYDYIYASYKQIMQNYEITEFKWSKLKSVNYYECAKEIIDMFFNNCFEYHLRVDVITWDTYDSRHKIKRRDDTSNFERMFYHLLKASMSKREAGSIFHIRPDERGEIDWVTIKECLTNIGRRSSEQSLFREYYSESTFKVDSFTEKDSTKEILIQIADLFSGMASYSKLYFNEYQEWKKQSFEQKQLFLFETPIVRLTNKKIYCSRLLDYFNKECKLNKMGVSLEKAKCLRSYKPFSPINFWPYQPQGDYDKAPTKN